MFQGFSQGAVDLLWGIRFNNERSWFLAHKQEFLDLVSEAYEVAKAKGVAVLPEHKKEFFDRFRMYRKDATSSLQRDLTAGRPAEIDTFSGYLVREAKRLGVAVPVSEKMYCLLQERAARSV